MSLHCPICNGDMLEKVIIPMDKSSKSFECVNEDCLVKPTLPEDFRSPSINALANMLIAAHAKKEELSHMVYTKNRQGQIAAYTFMGKQIQLALAVLGFEVKVSE